MNNNKLSEVGKNALIEMLVLFEQLPVEKQFYLLGYAQSEADKNLHSEAHG